MTQLYNIRGLESTFSPLPHRLPSQIVSFSHLVASYFSSILRWGRGNHFFGSTSPLYDSITMYIEHMIINVKRKTRICVAGRKTNASR